MATRDRSPEVALGIGHVAACSGQRARLGVRRLGLQLASMTLGQAHHLGYDCFCLPPHRMVGVSVRR